MEEKIVRVDRKNFDRRERLIILHYTVLDEKDSLETLTHGGVGAHFLIPKHSFQEGEKQFDYYKFLDIADRAWHAGMSYFAGRSGLNDTSIGIEIVNYGYGLVQKSGKVLFTYEVENELKGFITETLKKEDESLYQRLETEYLLAAFLGDMTRGLVAWSDRKAYKEKISPNLIDKYKSLIEKWREEKDAFFYITQENLYQLEQQGKLVWDEYTDHQINILVDLIKKIQAEVVINDEKGVYYQIPPQFITGHADIAPGRKVDPGTRLWKKLADRGIGAWPNEGDVSTIEEEIQIEQGIDYQWIQDNLRLYGYKIESTGQLDEQTRNVIRAFQMHFEPENYSGEPSIKTISLLEALIKKYYPSEQSNYTRSYHPCSEKKSNFFAEKENNSDSEENNQITTHCCVMS